MSLGVARGYVFPLRDATGSVTLIPLLAGSGAARIPSSTVLAQIQTYLNSLRIATDTAYVKAATASANLAIVVRVRPATGYQNDWDDGGYSTYVISCTGNQIVINTTTPANLAAAVTAGSSARVQLQIPGTALPLVTSVTAYADNVPSGGYATLTLATAPTATPSYMFAAGNATLQVATAVLSYVDSVGPSTASGFADPNDSWEDTVSIGRIAQSALDAVGADGRRCLIFAPNVGNDPSASVGVSINGSAADVPMLDYVPGSGPQIPVCTSVPRTQGISHGRNHGSGTKGRADRAFPPGVEEFIDWNDAPGDLMQAFGEAIAATAIDPAERLRVDTNPLTCGASKIADWEAVLKLSTTKTARTGTISQRRRAVISRLREYGSPDCPVHTIDPGGRSWIIPTPRSWSFWNRITPRRTLLTPTPGQAALLTFTAVLRTFSGSFATTHKSARQAAGSTSLSPRLVWSAAA